MFWVGGGVPPCNKYDELAANINEGIGFYARVREVMETLKAKVWLRGGGGWLFGQTGCILEIGSRYGSVKIWVLVILFPSFLPSPPRWVGGPDPGGGGWLKPQMIFELEVG